MKATTIAIGAGALVLALGSGGYAYVQSIRPQLELGTGYAARVACGCRYVANRPLADCRRDFEPGMEPIQLSEDTAKKTVTASVPLIASRSVRFDPVLMCVPEGFGGTALVVGHGQGR
jgi:hypothetical protein